MPTIPTREFKNSRNNNTGALVLQSLPVAEIVQRVRSQARDHGGLKASLLPSVLSGSRDEDAQMTLVPEALQAAWNGVTQGQEPCLVGDEGFTPRD